MAAWVAGVLICLALPVVIALHMPSIQRKIIRGGVARIEKATHLQVKISSWRWETLSSMELSGVKIESRGKTVLDCDSVRLDYRLSLKRPYIAVREVDLKKPFLLLERAADGKWLLPDFSTKKSHGAPGAARTAAWAGFQFPRIKILAGRIEAVQQGQTVLTIQDFSGAVALRTLHTTGGPKIQMEVRDFHARAHANQSGAWDIDGSASLDGLQLRTSGIVFSAAHNCRIVLRGQWNLQDPRNGQATLTVSNFPGGAIPLLQPQLGGISSVSGKIDIKRSEGKWTIEPDVSTDLGAMRGVVQIEKSGSGPWGIKLSSRFSALKVSVSQHLPGSILNGRISIEALMQGGNLLKADFHTHLDPSVVCARKLDRCDLRGTFAGGVLNVVATDAGCPLADFTFKVNADMRGLLDTVHKGGIKAEIDLVRGNLERIDPKLRYKLAGLVRLEAHYDSGTFTNPKLWQAKIDADLAVPGILTLKANGSYDNRLVKAVYDLDLADAQKIGLLFAKWQGKGRVVSRGSLQGKWPDLLWKGEIDSPRFGYANCQADRLSIAGNGVVAGKNGRRTLTLRAQNVVLDGKKFASVTVNLDQQNNSCDFKLSGDGILDQVTARLSGRLDRIWDFPRLSVSTRGSLGWKKVNGAVDARFSVEPNGIKVDSASFRYANCKVSATAGAITESSVKLPLSLDSIDAAKISALLGLKTPLGGTISGRLQVSGRPDQPACSLNLRGNNLTYDRQRIETLTLHGDYAKQALTVKGTAKAASVSTPILISGAVPLRLSFYPPRLELMASGKLDSTLEFSGLQVKSIPSLVHALSKAGGQLDGKIQCGGTLRRPVFSGAGTWKDGLLEIALWPHVAKHIQAQWRIDSKAIYLTRADLSHLGGTGSATGMIEYPGFQTFDVRAEAKDLDVPDIFGIKGKATGHAELKATPQSAALTGTLHIASARLDLAKLETNITQHKTIQVVESSGKGDVLVLQGVQGPSRFENKLSMDLALELPPGGSWVNGEGLRAEINGGIKLVKKPGGPVLVAGELHALRGVYSFHGKELKIVEGSFIFPGVPDTQPQIRIVCRKEIRDVTVQALVSGRLQHPKLVLSSIPAMNQVDIVSYFMFGRPAGDLSSAQSSQLQTGAAALLGSEGSNIMKSVLGESIITPDTIGYRSFTDKYNHIFSFDQDPTSVGKETGIVEVGKDVTPNLHVVYGREVKGAQGDGNEVQVEYRVNKSFSVSTQVGGEQSGADIFWRHDFGK
ncbi:MAG: translocation/assembly module TamB domain-containing protein [Syntrophobacteraceae bacterium]|nr:translocation/assembly module TamB domain-containing protein [Syntrophobacteraceae bacterium]